MKQHTVREWIEKYNAGDFAGMPCNAGWYDWFCTTRALDGRLLKMARLMR